MSFKSYIICTSPRSGSTLLCGRLRDTGVAGDPESLFHRPSLDAWLQSYGLARDDFDSPLSALRAAFDHAIHTGRGQTDTFGLRLQRHSFSYFTQQLAQLYPDPHSDLTRLQAVFGPTLFIHLTREDKLSQAVSRVMAEQTGLWHRHADGTELERLAPPKPPQYDATAIARHLRDLRQMDLDWQAWFKTQGITPLRLSYDTLSNDPQGCVAQILQALGQDPDIASQLCPPTAKLSNSINRDWIRRFQAEHEGL
jgi:LPS sulfotransferase NodH